VPAGAGCAYLKLNPGILVVQSAQNRATENAIWLCNKHYGGPDGWFVIAIAELPLVKIRRWNTMQRRRPQGRKSEATFSSNQCRLHGAAWYSSFRHIFCSPNVTSCQNAGVAAEDLASKTRLQATSGSC
jgi:hypothetical protein